jgi:hypothetical protein
MRLKHALAALIVVFSFAPVTAGPLDDAYAASAKGDYATALRLVRPLADQDIPHFARRMACRPGP